LIEEIEPAIAGISATTVDYEAAVKTAKGIRRFLPGQEFILGGMHASVSPEICSKEDRLTILP